MREWWLRTVLVLSGAEGGLRRAARRRRRGGGDRGPSRCSRSCCSPGSPSCSRRSTAGAPDGRPRLRRAARRRLGVPRRRPLRRLRLLAARRGAARLGARRSARRASFRRSRHLLAFAAVPVVLSLLLWPVEARALRRRLFRAGGADAGTRRRASSRSPRSASLAWAAALLVVGVRAVHGWSWAGRALRRAAAPVAVARAARLPGARPRRRERGLEPLRAPRRGSSRCAAPRGSAPSRTSADVARRAPPAISPASSA